MTISGATFPTRSQSSHEGKLQRLSTWQVQQVTTTYTLRHFFHGLKKSKRNTGNRKSAVSVNNLIQNVAANMKDISLAFALYNQTLTNGFKQLNNELRKLNDAADNLVMRLAADDGAIVPDNTPIQE